MNKNEMNEKVTHATPEHGEQASVPALLPPHPHIQFFPYIRKAHGLVLLRDGEDCWGSEGWRWRLGRMMTRWSPYFPVTGS